jgi:hypothetical protein
MSKSNKRKRESTSHTPTTLFSFVPTTLFSFVDTRTLTEKINDLLTELELTKDLNAKEYLTSDTAILKKLSEKRITILKNAYPRTLVPSQMLSFLSKRQKYDAIPNLKTALLTSPPIALESSTLESESKKEKRLIERARSYFGTNEMYFIQTCVIIFYNFFKSSPHFNVVIAAPNHGFSPVLVNVIYLTKLAYQYFLLCVEQIPDLTYVEFAIAFLQIYVTFHRYNRDDDTIIDVIETYRKLKYNNGEPMIEYYDTAGNKLGGPGENGVTRRLNMCMLILVGRPEFSSMIEVMHTIGGKRNRTTIRKQRNFSHTRKHKHTNN